MHLETKGKYYISTVDLCNGVYETAVFKKPVEHKFGSWVYAAQGGYTRGIVQNRISYNPISAWFHHQIMKWKYNK